MSLCVALSCLYSRSVFSSYGGITVFSGMCVVSAGIRLATVSCRGGSGVLLCVRDLDAEAFRHQSLDEFDALGISGSLKGSFRGSSFKGSVKL